MYEELKSCGDALKRRTAFVLIFFMIGILPDDCARYYYGILTGIVTEGGESGVTRACFVVSKHNTIMIINIK